MEGEMPSWRATAPMRKGLPSAGLALPAVARLAVRFPALRNFKGVRLGFDSLRGCAEAAMRCRQSLGAQGKPRQHNTIALRLLQKGGARKAGAKKNRPTHEN
jgi:hypothetical protein